MTLLAALVNTTDPADTTAATAAALAIGYHLAQGLPSECTVQVLPTVDPETDERSAQRVLVDRGSGLGTLYGVIAVSVSDDGRAATVVRGAIHREVTLSSTRDILPTVAATTALTLLTFA